MPKTQKVPNQKFFSRGYNSLITFKIVIISAKNNRRIFAPEFARTIASIASPMTQPPGTAVIEVGAFKGGGSDFLGGKINRMQSLFNVEIGFKNPRTRNLRRS